MTTQPHEMIDLHAYLTKIERRATTPHVMLALETLGKSPTAAIVAIGAVQFGLTADNTEWLGPTFYRPVTLASSTASGGTMDASTVLWWMRQDAASRAALQNLQAVTLDEALSDFAYWVKDLGTPHTDIRMWGCGPSFDNVILRGAFERHGIDPPWPYWGDRCLRTARDENPQIGPPQRQGIHHHALDDAMHQARHLCAIWRYRALRERAAIPTIGPSEG